MTAPQEVDLTRVSVVIPALNEEATVASVVAAALAEHPHEVLVIDSDSTDNTAAKALEAGATVYSWTDIAPEIPTRPGKGEALWRGVKAAQGEVVVFIDADLRDIPQGIVAKLTHPLTKPTVKLVKANYTRTLNGQPTGGGRVTELTAQPLLGLYYPQLGHINQPLAGEYAISREHALNLPFVDGYGVEVGLLVDTLAEFGPEAITQVDVGERTHRNRPLAQLRPMAEVVAATILARVGALPDGHRAPLQRPAWNTLG